MPLTTDCKSNSKYLNIEFWSIISIVGLLDENRNEPNLALIVKWGHMSNTLVHTISQILCIVLTMHEQLEVITLLSACQVASVSVCLTSY